MATLEYQLSTEPQTRVTIPLEAKTEAEQLLFNANPLAGGIIPTDNQYVGVPLVMEVLVAYRAKKLALDPALDILALNIAEQILTREGQMQRLHSITVAQDRVRKTYFG